MSEDKHTIIIGEDDAATAAQLKAYVESMGFVARVATTYEELAALVAKGGFCAALLDMEMPRAKGGAPDVVHGYAGLDLVRAYDRRRTPTDRHVLQILIVTGYARTPSFVSRVWDAGASGFIEKPFKAEDVLDALRGALKRSGREEHDACIALARRLVAQGEVAVVAEEEARVTLSISGRADDKGRSLVRVNRKDVPLPAEYFCLLVRLIVEYKRERGEPVERADLGLDEKSYLTSRVQTALEVALPEGFALIQSNRHRQCWLNPAAKVDRVAWKALTTHGHAGVRKAAEKMLEKEKR